MRKLLNTLFITSENSYLALENENIVVLDGDEKLGQFPLSILENIVSFSYRGASPALMGACADRGISLCFMSRNGRLLAGVTGRVRGNVLLRRQQYNMSGNNEQSTFIARNFIFSKLHNSRWILERMLRDHGMRIDSAKLKSASVHIASRLKPVSNTTSLDTLRGIEGEAAQIYFSVFDDLILNQKESFCFKGRSRRPPRDNVNAMLSLGYTLLANDCAASLESVGLDPYVGFLHRDRPGRASLAMDMSEELRGVVVDRLVLKLINTRKIQPRHFRQQPNGAVLLTDDGRKIFLNEWQESKRDNLTHPFLKEKIPWGLVPYVQSLLLARHLRGDLDGYPPFLWK